MLHVPCHLQKKLPLRFGWQIGIVSAQCLTTRANSCVNRSATKPTATKCRNASRSLSSSEKTSFTVWLADRNRVRTMFNHARKLMREPFCDQADCNQVQKCFTFLVIFRKNFLYGLVGRSESGPHNV